MGLEDCEQLGCSASHPALPCCVTWGRLPPLSVASLDFSTGVSLS